MNYTTLQIKCVGRDTNVKTLHSLIETFFPVAEKLEEELGDRQGQERIHLNDEVVWDLQVEGPDWDYLAQGTVTHMRGTLQMDLRKVSIHGSRVTWLD